MARQQRRARPNKAKRPAAKSDYFTQPGKRGSVIVLRKPIGNRITAKVCGVMPSRVHAKMLVAQLEKAAVLVGQGNKFELWNKDNWEGRMEQGGGFGPGGLPPELEGFSL